METKQISTVEEYKQLLENEGTFLFFKHSMTCPISANAFEEFEKFMEDHEEIPAYFLFVQHSRQLSSHIAETTAITHQSPQAILFKDGKPVWNDSHWSLTYDAFEKNVKR